MTGRSLKVNLVANTSQFKSAMSETSNQMKLINSEFKSAAAETDKYGNKLDQTGAKKKQLNGTIQQYTQRIKAIKNEQKHWTAELKKGNITETEHAQKQQELARRLNNTEAEMKKYEGQLKKLNAEGKNTTRTYADFDKKFREVGTTMRNVGAQVGITAGVGFMAMKRVLGDVVKEASTFHAGMSEVQAISGATGDELGKLTNQAKDLGKATMFTSQQASESMANLARAGFSVSEIYDTMPGLLDLAASSKMELGAAADVTANILRTFNFDAKESGRVADILAKGAATANQDVAGLAKSMEIAGPVANSLNLTFESVAAATGMMADAGVDGSTAGRMLRQGMLRLAKPTGDAGKLLKKMGVEAFDADGNMKSLDKVVAELEKGLKGQTKQQKAAALATIFGSESTAGWTVLLDKGADELEAYTKELENSEGAAKKMADVMQDNAEGAIIRMQSALSGLKIELGEKLLPILAKGADFIGDLANEMSEWDEETITTIAQTALLVTAVLGVTTVVAGLVAGLGAFMMVAGPIGLAVAAGTLLLGGLAAAAYKSSLETKNLAEKQEQGAIDAVRYGEGLSEGTKKGVKGYRDLYEGAKVKMLELKTMSGDEAKATSAEIVKSFSEMADAVIAELETQKEKLSAAINEVYAVAGKAGEKAAGEMSDKVLEAFDADIAAYKKALDVVKKVQEEFGGDVSKAPKALQKAYAESLEIMDGGAREFAKNQDELRIIQKNIAETQGGIMFEEVSGYTKKINETYDESIKSALGWNAEKKEVFEQGLAQGVISTEEYASLMAATEATTTQMMAESASEQEKSLSTLSANLNERGKLIDLSTGEEFERKKWLQTSSTGIQTQVEESELAYLERWRKHKNEHLESTSEFATATLEQQKNTLVATLEGLGMTSEAAVKEAEKLMKGTLEELDKGEPEAKESGKKKGKAHKDGLEETKGENEKAGDNVSKVSTDYLDLEKWNEKSKKSGKKKGDAHKDGLNSTKGANENSGAGVSDGTSKKLDTNADKAKKAGKGKGDAHKSGLDGTKSANTGAGSLLSAGVSLILSKTTDGGGGRTAGSLFATGIRSQSGSASTAGTGVATSGKRGLGSVSTSSTGTDFVSGFRRSISSGSGSVWTTAWSLGKSALSALKKSIKSASPSKETGELGIDFTDGFSLAIDKGKKKSIKSAMMVGKETTQSLSDEIDKYKQSFGAIALAVEGNKQTLKVEHTLDKKFDEFASMFKSINSKKDNDESFGELLKATLQQNQLLMQLLQKDNNVYLGTKRLARELTPDISRLQGDREKDYGVYNG